MRRIPRIELVEPGSGLAYLRVSGGSVEILDADVLARALGNAELAAALAAMAPPVRALCEKSAPARRRDMLA